MKITYENIMSWEPCHDAEKCLELLKGKKEYELMDFLDLDSVSAEEKLWAVLRPEVIAERTLHEFGIWCALSVIHLFEEKYPDDKRPRLAIEAKQKWLDGEITDEELASAESAVSAASAAWAERAESAARASWAASAAIAAWAARAASAASAAWDARSARSAQLEQLKIMLT